jgi:hypothetical protein
MTHESERNAPDDRLEMPGSRRPRRRDASPQASHLLNTRRKAFLAPDRPSKATHCQRILGSVPTRRLPENRDE